MNCTEAAERITALVDNELSDLERRVVEPHIISCSRCGYAFELEQELKRQIHAVGARIMAPPALREKILADRRIFPETKAAVAGWGWVLATGPLVRPVLVVALLALLVVPLSFFLRSKPMDSRRKRS